MPAKYKYITTDSKGEHEITGGRPKNGYHRRPSERAKAPTKAKAKDIKLSGERWDAATMHHFFFSDIIHADTTDWFITFESPNRKMTAADQLILMLVPHEMYEVQVNYQRKHLIIDHLPAKPL